MAIHDISPDHASNSPVLQESHSVHDDFELSPISELDSDGLWLNQEVESPKPSAARKWMWGVLLAGSAIFAGLWYQQGVPEQRHENWQHVVAASNASTAFVQNLAHVDGAGNSKTLRSLAVSAADRNLEATRKLRSALWRNDLVTATATLRGAQGLKSVADTDDLRLPILLPNLALTAALRDGREELFQIELFDCCDEDGDVVEILVNGTSFATVPITNGGTVLAIPLSRGQNSVTLLATRDGGGGVTVSLRTSRGDYFARYMDEGESHQMGVVVQ